MYSREASTCELQKKTRPPKSGQAKRWAYDLNNNLGKKTTEKEHTTETAIWRMRPLGFKWHHTAKPDVDFAKTATHPSPQNPTWDIHPTFLQHSTTQRSTDWHPIITATTVEQSKACVNESLSEICDTCSLVNVDFTKLRICTVKNTDLDP